MAGEEAVDVLTARLAFPLPMMRFDNEAHSAFVTAGVLAAEVKAPRFLNSSS